jgi:hypothetical protein
VISIAPLTAILMMTAAVSAIAATKDDRVACDERSFPPDDAGLRIGHLGQSRDPTATAVERRVEPPGPIPEDDFGLKPKLTYARGSVEWEAEQRRLKNNAAPE